MQKMKKYSANLPGTRLRDGSSLEMLRSNAVAKEHDAAALFVYKRAVPTFKPKLAREPAETNRPQAPPALA